MITKYKYSKNSIESVFNDLKLFEQNSYCYEYIRKKYDEIEEEK